MLFLTTTRIVLGAVAGVTVTSGALALLVWAWGHVELFVMHYIQRVFSLIFFLS